VEECPRQSATSGLVLRVVSIVVGDRLGGGLAMPRSKDRSSTWRMVKKEVLDGLED
jgi:hypothetical protein